MRGEIRLGKCPCFPVSFAAVGKQDETESQRVSSAQALFLNRPSPVGHVGASPGPPVLADAGREGAKQQAGADTAAVAAHITEVQQAADTQVRRADEQRAVAGHTQRRNGKVTERFQRGH
jgi:hypothetical protein